LKLLQVIEKVRSQKEAEFYRIEVDELEQVVTGPEALIDKLEKDLELFTENELIQ
jgi:hypothetical protein